MTSDRPAGRLSVASETRSDSIRSARWRWTATLFQLRISAAWTTQVPAGRVRHRAGPVVVPDGVGTGAGAHEDGRQLQNSAAATCRRAHSSPARPGLQRLLRAVLAHSAPQPARRRGLRSLGGGGPLQALDLNDRDGRAARCPLHRRPQLVHDRVRETVFNYGRYKTTDRREGAPEDNGTVASTSRGCRSSSDPGGARPALTSAGGRLSSAATRSFGCSFWVLRLPLGVGHAVDRLAGVLVGNVPAPFGGGGRCTIWTGSCGRSPVAP